jgi:hypothetical protein
MEDCHSRDSGQPARQQVDEGCHLERDGLVLDVDHIQVVGLRPAARLHQTAPVPILDQAINADAILCGVGR